jgi:hypothetical protein
VVDSLEEQKLEQMMDFHQKKRRNQDLLKEFKVYEDMISQVYIVEYEDPPPGTPGSGQRRVRRVRNPSLQLSSSTGTPKRSASAHGPKLSVSDISSLLSMVGDGSSTESSPRKQRHSRDNSFDQSKFNTISSKDLADRLAPLASSTPGSRSPERKGSLPGSIARSSSAEPPSQTRLKKQGEREIGT